MRKLAAPQQIISLQREMRLRMYAVAVISTLLSGGAAACYYYGVLYVGSDTQGNGSNPGLLIPCIIFIATLLLSLLTGFFMVKKLSSKMETLQDSPDSGEDNADYLPEGRSASIIAEKDKALAELHSQMETSRSDNVMLRQQLEAEQLISSLALTLLSSSAQHDPALRTRSVLTSLQQFTLADYAAFYILNSDTLAYERQAGIDAQPQTARHGDRIEKLPVTSYGWMLNSLKAGDIFCFDTASLDSLDQQVPSASHDWLRYNLHNTAEYQLCKQEGWAHMACLPCHDAEELKAILLLGFTTEAFLPALDTFRRLAPFAHNLVNTPPAISYMEREVPVPVEDNPLPSTINHGMDPHCMEAISYFSSGLAHDFNNLLAAMLGNISLVIDDLPPGSDNHELLKTAEDCISKGKEITDQLLTFSKASPPEPTSSDTTYFLQMTVDALTTGTQVSVNYSIADRLPSVNISKDSYQRIIEAIVTNALEAMPKGGEITVKAMTCPQQELSSIPLPHGDYVCLHITDTGEGIAPSHQSRVFVPYFTTRSGHKGMGLPTAYALVRKHDGYIRLSSQPGVGTDCEIILPVARQANKPLPVSRQNTGKTANRVLLLEDEEVVANLLAKTLAKHGLDVDIQSDPDEMMVWFYRELRDGSPYQLIILDLLLSSGADITALAAKLRLADRNVKLVACSGYLKADDLPLYQEKGFDAILPKPFYIADIKALLSTFSPSHAHAARRDG